MQLILKQYNSKFTTYKLPPSVYTFKDLSRNFKNEFEVRGGVQPKHKHVKSDSIIIDSDNVSLITKLRLGPQMNVLGFEKELFFDTILDFTPYWDYKSHGNEY